MKNVTLFSTFAVACNSISTTIPSTFNSLPSLQTLFLFSNKLRWNFPRLDHATELGKSNFRGITYPLSVQAHKDLYNSGLINALQSIYLNEACTHFFPLSKIPSSYAQVLENVTSNKCSEIVIPGNAQLMTSASRISGDAAPNSLQADQAASVQSECSVSIDCCGWAPDTLRYIWRVQWRCEQQVEHLAGSALLHLFIRCACTRVVQVYAQPQSFADTDGGGQVVTVHRMAS